MLQEKFPDRAKLLTGSQFLVHHHHQFLGSTSPGLSVAPCLVTVIAPSDELGLRTFGLKRLCLPLLGTQQPRSTCPVKDYPVLAELDTVIPKAWATSRLIGSLAREMGGKQIPAGGLQTPSCLAGCPVSTLWGALSLP